METFLRSRGFALGLALASVTISLSASAEVPDRAPLEPYRAKYHVHSSGMRAGEIVSTLSRDGDEFVFETRAKSRGLAALFAPRRPLEISRFRVGADGLVAISYVRDAGKSDDRDDTSAEFDWDRATVATVDKGLEVDLPLEPGMIERHILPLAVALGLRRGEPPPFLTLVERDRIKRFQIEPQGRETVKAAGRDYEALKFLQHRAESDRQTTIWFAPELGFIPVKFEIRDKRGLRARIVLEELGRGAD